MGHQQAWKELMDLIEVMREFDLEDETVGLILSIEHIHSEIIEQEQEQVAS